MKFLSDRMDAIISGVASVFLWGAVGTVAFAEAREAPKIRVRIIDGAPQIRARGFDLRLRSSDRYDLRIQQSSASRSAKKITAQVDRLSEWKFSCPNGGVVQATQMGNGKFPLQTLYFAGPLMLDSPAGFVTVKGKQYREKVSIHSVASKAGWRCEAVNHVDIESYLDGLVNAEFSAAWSPEAIDAQVIAARTYAYFQMKAMDAKKGGSHFDLDSTTKDQVYDGSQREDYRSRMSSLRTRGWILKASAADAWPIKAYYHSTCGGTTELPQVVWGAPSRGFRSRVHCAYCQSSPSFVWDVPLGASEVALEIWKGARELGVGERDAIRNWPLSWERELRSSQLLELRVTSQNESGRAETVTSRWRNPEGKEYTLAMPGTLFRSWIGPSRLKSTVFQVYAAGGGQWVLRGRGFGHGVGLCQWGAKTMGEQGKKAREILRTYYPDAVLAKGW